MPATKQKEKTEIEIAESVPAIVEPRETGLSLIDPAKVPAYFAKGGCDPLIQTLQAELDRFLPTIDISTPKGQKEVRSFLYKLARSRTAIDEAGKKFVAGPKAVAKVGDEERARVRKAIEAMEAKAGEALAAWEESQEKRKDAHKRALEEIQALAAYASESESIPALNERLDSLGKYTNRAWDEFSLKAELAIGSTRKILTGRIEAIEKATAEREAQEAIDLAEEIRARKARELEIAEKAAARAKADAERAAEIEAARIAGIAKRDAERAAQAIKDAEERAALVERIRIAGEEKAKQDAVAAENARIKKEQDHAAAIKKAQDDAALAIEKARAKAAADKLKADQAHAAAIQKALDDAESARREAIRQEQILQDQEAAKENARRADERHRMQIDAQVLADLYAVIREIPSDSVATANDVAECIFKAVRDGFVRHTTIAY